MEVATLPSGWVVETVLQEPEYPPEAEALLADIRARIAKSDEGYGERIARALAMGQPDYATELRVEARLAREPMLREQYHITGMFMRPPILIARPPAPPPRPVGVILPNDEVVLYHDAPAELGDEPKSVQ